MTSSDFAELQLRIREAGLLERSPARFLLRFGIVLLLWTAGIFGLFFLENIWFLILDIIFLSQVYTQISFCSHEVGHHQIFKNPKWHAVIGLICSYITGMSYYWWMQTHNKHHANPNHEDLDPDIDVMFLTYANKCATRKKGILRWMVCNQQWLFFPLITMSALNMRVSSLRWALKQRGTPYFWTYVFILSMWCITYFTILFWLFPPLVALLLLGIHHMVWGFHLGIVFAPNHKGMLVVEDGMELDFVRKQVLTSRNVRANVVTDMLYGGLNYQIEHHLFPTMPQWNYRKARKIVRAFCEEKGISYHETCFFGSLVEIVQHLKSVAQVARYTKM